MRVKRSYPGKSGHIDDPEQRRHLCLLVSEKHPAFQAGETPPLSAFSDGPLFLPMSMSVSQINHYKETARKEISPDVTVKKLDSPETVRLYLRAAKGFTIVTPWDNTIHTPGFRVIPLRKATSLSAQWNAAALKNSFSSLLIKLLQTG